VSAATWDDINARTRGLAGHLVTSALLDELAESPDVPAFARSARVAGLIAPETGAQSALELELALRRAAARQFRIVLRWLDRRAALLRVVIEDEDRRSVRAMIRGAAAAAPAETRLAGLVPTPTLPERLLEELARQPRPRDVAALLAAWQHPFGTAALTGAAGEHPDLFRFELEVDRVFAGRAVEGARGGAAVLRSFVAETIDYANLQAALMLAGAESEQAPESAFLAGGARMTRERFLHAVAAGPASVAERLATAFPTEEARIIRRYARDAGALERELLARRIHRLLDLARRDPLGPAPVLRYFLRLRAQAMNLRLLLWGAALGAPAVARRERLVRAA
jgi:vacuolar-type H+-ATPase subunit C/Vma6